MASVGSQGPVVLPSSEGLAVEGRGHRQATLSSAPSAVQEVKRSVPSEFQRK